jgi:hypothetical protein
MRGCGRLGKRCNSVQKLAAMADREVAYISVECDTELRQRAHANKDIVHDSAHGGAVVFVLAPTLSSC